MLTHCLYDVREALKNEVVITDIQHINHMLKSKSYN